MQINSWLNLIIYIFFTLGVILIGIPVSLYLFKKGIEGFLKYGFNKLPENYLVAPGLGTYSFEIFFYGLLVFSFSVWYLFFDKGGQLVNFLSKVKPFLFK